MKSSSLFLVFALAFLAPACQKSEISDQPAAEVSDTGATVTADTAANSTAPTPGAVTTNVVKEKSKIEWVAGKVTRDHNGKFANFDGWLEYAAGKPSRLSFDIDLNAIESDDEKLTGHLKSPDFFDVAKYPKATFTSTSLTEAPAGSADGTTHMLNGTLDLHGVQKAVSIPVKAEQTAEGVHATSQFTINRHDWGISYKGMADDLIKDNVLIKLDLMFPPPPAA
ncbi:MAG TPA: YceI family protein [Thermoanaerobaculia bacterium]|nr:YceI family protein [Thermoanaerobaculia bacterium]